METGKTELPTIFIAKTRYDVEDKMKLNEVFEARSNLSPFNRKIINSWMKKYRYEKIKSRYAFDLYMPQK